MRYTPDSQQVFSQPKIAQSYYEVRSYSGDSSPAPVNYHITINAKDISFARLGTTLVIDRSLESEFNSKAQQWKKDTRGLSSVSEIVLHPSYQWIMAKGELALPFILRDLRQNGGQWFHALYYIHGRDEAAGAKTVEEAIAAWTEWGYRNNHI